jgi:nucleoside-diphosphate-sugar epimerase
MPELGLRDLEEVVAEVACHWDALRGGHILITGGTGFIGTWLIESFVAAEKEMKLGAHATVITRDPDRYRAKAPHLANHPSIRLFTGDLRTTDFPSGNFSHVIHAAADASRSQSSDGPVQVFDTIVTGMRRLLDFCAQSEVPNLLFLSSGAVYGSQPADLPRINEDYPSGPPTNNPASSYAEAKRRAELLCTAYAATSAMRVAIARCFAFLGPHLPMNGPFAAGNFVRDVIRGGPVAVCGNAATVRSYLYAGDLAAWLWIMLLNPRAAGIYNVGSDQPVTIGELAEMFASSGGVGIRFTETPTGAPSRYVPCVDRARMQLGLQVRLTLDEGIRRTLRWYLDNSYNE